MTQLPTQERWRCSKGCALADKLFHIANNQISALQGSTETVEKAVQVLFGKNLEALIGVRFLASEFITTNGGRMDTLGLDENGIPVIVDYKRATNENVINGAILFGLVRARAPGG
jgi:RecB family endonuclease NucS